MSLIQFEMDTFHKQTSIVFEISICFFIKESHDDEVRKKSAKFLTKVDKALNENTKSWNRSLDTDFMTKSEVICIK